MRGVDVVLYNLAQLITPHFGHHDVRYNQVGEILFHDVKRRFAVGAYLHVVVLGQSAPQVFPQFVVILYYQYLLAVIGILGFLLGVFVAFDGRIGGRSVRRIFLRSGDLLQLITPFRLFLFHGNGAVYGLAVALLAFGERYFDAGAFSFGTGKVELSLMYMYELPYEK